LTFKIRKDAFAIQLFCLILVQAPLADEAGRLQEFSRLRMEMQPDGVDNEMLMSGSMDHPIYVGMQDGLKKVDKISELPGQPGKAVFDQYAGYITVDATTRKALFYYFAEAAEEPSTKPLVLWLNGGKEPIAMWFISTDKCFSMLCLSVAFCSLYFMGCSLAKCIVVLTIHPYKPGFKVQNLNTVGTCYK
jgi:hypothetical protein